MKKILFTILGLLLLSQVVYSATVCYPVDGCTGTSTVPSLGQILVGQSNGTYAPQATSTLGITVTPGGSDTQLQFNDGGVFGGDDGLTYDKTSDVLTIGSGLNIAPTLELDSNNIQIFQFGKDEHITYQGVPFALLWDSGNGWLSFQDTDANPYSVRVGNILVNSITSTYVPYASTNGLLIGNSGFNFASSILTVPYLTASNNINLQTSSGSTVGNIFKNGSRFIHTYGSSNTFVGINSGNFTNTSSPGGNMGFGENTLTSLTSGNRNMAIGVSSLQSLTSGGENVAVGSAALFAVTTSGANVAIGSDAGRSATTNAGGAGGGTYIGYEAGYKDNNGFTTPGNIFYGTAIGAYAQVGQSNTIVLGGMRSFSGARVGIGNWTPSAKLVVQNLYEDTFTELLDLNTSGGSATSPTNIVQFRFKANGTAGFGTSSPTALLHISTTTPGMDVLKVTAGSQTLVYDSSGNLGIGTTSPYAKLSVAGPVVAEYVHATTTATSTFGFISTGANEGIAHDVIRHTIAGGDIGASSISETWSKATRAKIVSLAAVILNDDGTAVYNGDYSNFDPIISYDGSSITVNVAQTGMTYSENEAVTIYIVYEK